MAEKWVIADTNEAELIDFPTGSIETSVNDVYVAGTINGVAHDNLHVSGSKTFVKYNRAPAQAEVLYQVGDTNIPSGSSVGDVKIAAADEEEVPASVAGLTSKSQEYTHSEILNILTGSEWVDSSMPEK